MNGGLCLLMLTFEDDEIFVVYDSDLSTRVTLSLIGIRLCKCTNKDEQIKAIAAGGSAVNFTAFLRGQFGRNGAEIGYLIDFCQWWSIVVWFGFRRADMRTLPAAATTNTHELYRGQWRLSETNLGGTRWFFNKVGVAKARSWAPTICGFNDGSKSNTHAVLTAITNIAI
jgi:hypothetical protein